MGTGGRPGVVGAGVIKVVGAEVTGWVGVDDWIGAAPGTVHEAITAATSATRVAPIGEGRRLCVDDVAMAIPV